MGRNRGMKLLALFTLILIIQPFLMASDRMNPDFDDYENNHLSYKFSPKSLVRWDEIDEINWLDLEQWKRQRDLRNDIRDWRLFEQETNLQERMGRVLKCVGSCRAYRGDKEGNFPLAHRSLLIEGDEVVTLKDSYAWIYLYDGTMLRISPMTSISLIEVNVSKKDFFYYVRLNYGQIYWHPRMEESLVENEKPETDVLFFPLMPLEAHTNVTINHAHDESNLIKYLGKNRDEKRKYQRLNKLKTVNNKRMKTKLNNFLFALTNNVTFFSENQILHLVALRNGPTYVKVVDHQQLFFQEEKEESELNDEDAQKANGQMKQQLVEYALRNSEESQREPLPVGQWYVIDREGKMLESLDGEVGLGNMLKMSEFATRRIPTILIARELWLHKYSQLLFEDSMSRIDLATKYGRRLWTEMAPGHELDERVKFLHQFTHDLEIRAMKESLRMGEELQKQGKKVPVEKYDYRFFQRVMKEYWFRQKKSVDESSYDKPILNSMKKKFWKIINGHYE